MLGLMNGFKLFKNIQNTFGGTGIEILKMNVDLCFFKRIFAYSSSQSTNGL